MPDPEEISPSDTLYTTSEDTPPDAVHVVREAFVAAPELLNETGVESRRQQLLASAQKRSLAAKTAAKTAVSVLDNLDAILGMIERVFLVALTELIRRGDWISACLVCLLAIVAWVWKIRRPEPGPAVKFFRQDSQQIRARFVSAAKTLYRG